MPASYALSAGICGGDVPQYKASTSPRILGPENVGTIEKIGPVAVERWGLKVGDMVVLEEYLPCGHCDFCLTAEYRSCFETDARANASALRYGTTLVDILPSLWGGYSQFQFLHPRSIFHARPKVSIPTSPRWPCRSATAFSGRISMAALGLRRGGRVRPGQQCLACAVAAKVSGASKVIVMTSSAMRTG
jgi:threonine dehydrogenase-like Zn-dependent dehydrogenase